METEHPKDVNLIQRAVQLDVTLESLGCGGGTGTTGSTGTGESSYGSGTSLPLAGHKVLYFPLEASESVVKATTMFPNESPLNILRSIYPTPLFQLEESGTETGYAQSSVLDAALRRFGFGEGSALSHYVVDSVSPVTNTTASITFRPTSSASASSSSSSSVSVVVPSGTRVGSTSSTRSRLRPGPQNEYAHTLAGMLRSHALSKDICLVGTKGSGKTALSHEFRDLLGYQHDEMTVCCYRDMSPRDLFMRRSTDSEGNTQWARSPVVTAALEGKLCVLDGIHRLTDDTLSSLASLTSDRELQMFDGTRVVSKKRHAEMIQRMMEEQNKVLNKEQCVAELKRLGVHCVHPSFRLLALAEPPGKERDRWLQSETLGLNLDFTILPDLPLLDKVKFVTEGGISRNVDHLPTALRDVGLRTKSVFEALAIRMEERHQGNKEEATLFMSLRQMKRVWEGILADAESSYNWNAEKVDAEIKRRVWLSQLAEFAPKAIQDSLEMSLKEACSDIPHSFHAAEKHHTISTSSTTIDVQAAHVRIGATTLPLPTEAPMRPELVPNPLFIDVPHMLNT